MHPSNLVSKRSQVTALAVVVATFLFSAPNCFADENHPESIIGVWTIKSHLVGDDLKESTVENEKTGATWKFRKNGTWKPGETNDFLYWSYSDATKEMETWDTILGIKAKGTVCHYDVEFSKDAKTMTWKGKNMFGIKQQMVFEKK